MGNSDTKNTILIEYLWCLFSISSDAVNDRINCTHFRISIFGTNGNINNKVLHRAV